MGKKYRTVKEGNMLRIIALKDFHDVKKGEEGGLIESKYNLDQDGDCWIYKNACVSGNARVYQNAMIKGQAKIFDNAEIYGKVKGFARVYDNAKIFEDAEVSGNAWVEGNAVISGKVKICGNARVSGSVKLWSTAFCFIDTSSIENSKDYIIRVIEEKFHVSLCNTLLEDDIKNIKTIRQLYGKEV